MSVCVSRDLYLTNFYFYFYFYLFTYLFIYSFIYLFILNKNEYVK